MKVTLVVLSLFALSASSATLPFYNVDGYQTIRVSVDPLTHTFSRSAVSFSGVGVYIEPPNGTETYSEVVTASGAIVQIREPLLVVSEAWLYDIQRSAPYNGGVFIAAASDSVVFVGNHRYELIAGQGIVVPPDGAVTHVTTQLGGAIYVFGFVNHQVTGSVQIVPAR